MTDDWADALLALLEAGARFLVVGAHAMAVHGVPRALQAPDVWIEATGENAGRVWKALAAFGPPLEDLGITPADFMRTDAVVQIGLPPNRIDVLTDISGVTDFESAWKERVELQVRGRSVPFLGRETLVRNKRATGRLKDGVDLEALGEEV